MQSGRKDRPEVIFASIFTSLRLERKMSSFEVTITTLKLYFLWFITTQVLITGKTWVADSLRLSLEMVSETSTSLSQETVQSARKKR